MKKNPDFVKKELKVDDETSLDKKMKMLTLILLAEENQVLKNLKLKLVVS